ncbi:hypothetical protein PENTCL1PPCAC_15593, partial [Pristionchus entomophagus]
CAQPVLWRVKTAYEKLCFGRMTGELFARKDPPSPMEIHSKNYPVYPATFATMNHANRVLMTCFLEFGASSFPEFALLSQEEQWSMAKKFFYTFRMLDNSYRARTYFSEVPNRVFGAYTLYISEDTVENFFDDFTDERGNVEEAKKMMAKVCETRPRKGRAILEKMNPNEQEFLALITLLFWATREAPIREEVTQLGERYRQEIMKELHIFYREQQKVEDYAARLGELLMFLSVFD